MIQRGPLRQAVDDIAAIAGVRSVKVSVVPAPIMWALGLFKPVIRELKETDYQLERPYLLDDSAARATFGIEPTPWNEVLTTLIEGYRPMVGTPAP